MPQFSTFHDYRGDLWVTAGNVICLKSGAVFPLPGNRFADAPQGSRGAPAGWVPFNPPAGATCLGGSGNNLVLTATITNPALPLGLFRPDETDSWVGTLFPDAALVWDPDGSVYLWDGTNYVVQLFSGTSAYRPAGTYAATAYGRTTYNGGSAFNIISTWEGGGNLCGAVVMVSSGTATAGVYAGTLVDTWTSGGWSIEPSLTGDGLDLSDGTDVVAARDGGSLVDPTGYYLTTSYGRTTYGATAGDDFQVSVAVIPAVPMAGYAWCQVTEDSGGSVVSVAGPFFSTTLPSQSGLVWPVPIARTGAGDPVQYVDGPILWRANFAATSHVHPDYQTARVIAIAGL